MIGDFILGFLIGAYIMARFYEPIKNWIKEAAKKHNGRDNNN